MARAYILSHGARVGGAADTFVPAGRTISFYSEYDRNTLRSVGLAALNTGDITPTETKTGPCPVSNYYHSRFEDEAIAQHLASESSASGGRSYYVGSDLPDPSWLCTTPTACQATYPQHAEACQGVFRRVAEEEIYSVACRGLIGGPGGSTMEMEGSREFLDETQTEAKRILDWAKTDQAAAMQYWESLTQATRTMLAANYTPLRRYAEQYFTGGGASTPEAVLEARRYLEAYGEETTYEWIQSLDPAGRQRQIIMADDQFSSLVDRINRVRLLGSAAGGQGDPTAVLRARIDEQATAIALAVEQFTGGEQDSVDTVAQAYTTFMGEVTTYQSSAEPAHASQAASLYSAGAEVGTKLAEYQEQHDTESLAQLKTAVETMCQWSRSLTTV